jgi:hypothetical protein
MIDNINITVKRYYMENQVQLNAERVELLDKFREAVPQFMAAEAEVIEIAYKEGALSSKVKRLIALAAVQIAEKLKIPSTFVETNCSWCKTDTLTRERFQTLKDNELKRIMISVNPFYTEHIPFERTDRCLRLSQEVFGQNVMVYQLEYYHLFNRPTPAAKLH